MLIVALSGGIDSTALALLCPEATLVFTDTGWEFPELYAHLDRIEHVTGRPIVRLTGPHPGGLPGYIRDHAYFPGIRTRYCTRLFKIDPLNRWLASRLPCTLAIGLRADEPQRPGNLTQMDGLSIRYPLREQGLSRADCVQTCLEHDLLPRYPPYMLRGGCRGCFFKRRSELEALLALAPDLFEDLVALEADVQDVRGRYYGMFTHLPMPLTVLKAQPLLFDPQAVYTTAPQDDGSPCGLLCHR